jgi:hypothetical protein
MITRSKSPAPKLLNDIFNYLRNGKDLTWTCMGALAAPFPGHFQPHDMPTNLEI